MKMKEIPLEYMLDERLLGKGVDHVLYRIGSTVKRGQDSMGNNLIKNHLMLHIPQYASRWGPMTGMDSGDSERNHKSQVKPQSKWTQRREYNFQGQFGKRWHETRLVNRAVNRYRRVHGLFMERMQSKEEADRYVTADKNKITLGGSHFEIGINSGGQPTMGWLDETKRGRATHPQPVIDFVCNHVLNKVQDNTIVGRTEVSLLVESKKEIFRAHPNYWSDSNQRVNMWYDWAKFERFTRHGNRRILPGQIAAFITIKELGEGLYIPKVRCDKLIASTTYAVVRLFEGEPKLNFWSQHWAKAVPTPIQ